MDRINIICQWKLELGGWLLGWPFFAGPRLFTFGPQPSVEWGERQDASQLTATRRHLAEIILILLIDAATRLR